ncbi:MAG: ComF family protein [Clostridia bacterium]|nr:ComF family protein [Clostridia bacterium]
MIFPPVCGFCNEINDNFLCDKCERKLEQEKISKVDDYNNQPVFFDKHFYLFQYHKDIRDYIIKYKFDEKSYMYKSFSKLFINDKVFTTDFINKYDVIISVPIHRKRMKQRGYNQSELIAKDVAWNCNKTYLKKVLLKKDNILAQSSIEDKLDRIKNIKDAFYVGQNIDLIKGKKVAIFDDVFTTGATVNECAKVLKHNGADSVGIFTIAKS